MPASKKTHKNTGLGVQIGKNTNMVEVSTPRLKQLHFPNVFFDQRFGYTKVKTGGGNITASHASLQKVLNDFHRQPSSAGGSSKEKNLPFHVLFARPTTTSTLNVGASPYLPLSARYHTTSKDIVAPPESSAPTSARSAPDIPARSRLSHSNPSKPLLQRTKDNSGRQSSPLSASGGAHEDTQSGKVISGMTVIEREAGLIDRNNGIINDDERGTGLYEGRAEDYIDSYYKELTGSAAEGGDTMYLQQQQAHFMIDGLGLGASKPVQRHESKKATSSERLSSENFKNLLNQYDISSPPRSSQVHNRGLIMRTDLYSNQTINGSTNQSQEAFESTNQNGAVVYQNEAGFKSGNGVFSSNARGRDGSKQAYGQADYSRRNEAGAHKNSPHNRAAGQTVRGQYSSNNTPRTTGRQAFSANRTSSAQQDSKLKGTEDSASSSSIDSTDMALPFGDNLSSSNRLIELNNENKLKTLEPPRLFRGPPEKKPNCVCFDYVGTNITHKLVLEAVRESLKHAKDNRVLAVQFEARNVIVGTMWMNNRWIITLGTEAIAASLVYRCINIHGKRVKCHLYDKLMADEYQKYKTKYKIKDEGDKEEQGEIATLLSSTAAPES